MNHIALYSVGQLITLIWAFRYTRQKYGKIYPQDVILLFFGSFGWPIVIVFAILWWLSSKMEKYLFL